MKVHDSLEKKISRNGKPFSEVPSRRSLLSSGREGFSLIEVIVVVGLIGIMSLVSIPSILNILEERALESTIRGIQSSLNQARFQAVSSKLRHRVRFYNGPSGLQYDTETEKTSGEWVVASKSAVKIIPSRFISTFNLPMTGTDSTVVFSSLGMIDNYSSSQNSITLKSLKLTRYGDDQRVLRLYVGGAIRYLKS